MALHHVKVNGVRIAYRVQGEGPPLVLVMGYRLSSSAWPPTFIEQLARRFTVITLDDRGTGLSDKPVTGMRSPTWHGMYADSSTSSK